VQQVGVEHHCGAGGTRDLLDPLLLRHARQVLAVREPTLGAAPRSDSFWQFCRVAPTEGTNVLWVPGMTMSGPLNGWFSAREIETLNARGRGRAQFNGLWGSGIPRPLFPAAHWFVLRLFRCCKIAEDKGGPTSVLNRP
jgi:hypothetical protein